MITMIKYLQNSYLIGPGDDDYGRRKLRDEEFAKMTDWKRYQENRKRLGEKCEHEYKDLWENAEADVSELIAENERLREALGWVKSVRDYLAANLARESELVSVVCPYCRNTHKVLSGGSLVIGRSKRDLDVVIARAAMGER